MRGRWVILFHQHSESEARERVEVLDRVVAAFYLFWTDLGLDLKLPDSLLVTAWYSNHGDFLAFLERENAKSFRTAKGYYHPTRQMVIAYDTRTDEPSQKSRLLIHSLQNEVKRLDDVLNRLPRGGQVKLQRQGEPPKTLNRQGLTTQRDWLISDIKRRTVLDELQWREVEFGTAAHEMIHLLIIKSTLAPRFDLFPLWLHEGLATQFENIEAGRWAGLGHPHNLRLPDYRAISPAPRLSPLLKDMGLSEGYHRDSYAATWSLVNYFLTERRAQFLVYLDLIRNQPTPTKSRTDLIREAFGQDLPDLEASWHLFAKGQKTLSERELPSRTHPLRQ